MPKNDPEIPELTPEMIEFLRKYAFPTRDQDQFEIKTLHPEGDPL